MNMSVKGEDRCRGIFERPVASFEFHPQLNEWILSDFANPLNRIIQLIPDDAMVLDVGVGNGVLARLLKDSRRNVTIDGIEPDSAARNFSVDFYRKIFDCSLEEFLECEVERSSNYDVIVMADVIEHLPNPEPCLRGLKILLKNGGKIIISTPNVAFLSVRLALLAGNFTYVDSGILERTHLRFFTRSTLTQLFSAVGLFPTKEFHCLRDPFSTEIVLDGKYMSLALLAKLNRDNLAGVYQFLFVLGTESCQESVSVKLGSTGGVFPINYVRHKLRGLMSKLLRSIR